MIGYTVKERLLVLDVFGGHCCWSSEHGGQVYVEIEKLPEDLSDLITKAERFGDYMFESVRRVDSSGHWIFIFKVN